jgi:hypothetical protein
MRSYSHARVPSTIAHVVVVDVECAHAVVCLSRRVASARVPSSSASAVRIGMECVKK